MKIGSAILFLVTALQAFAQAIPGGVPVGGFISPNSEGNSYPVTKTQYQKGGVHTWMTSTNQLTSTSAINGLPMARREAGMLSIIDGVIYQLDDDLVTWSVAESINVKMFGAKADFDPSTGTGTDDTAAIQAAIDFSTANNYLPVYIPAGSYSATSIEVNGGMIYGDGGWFPRGSPTIIYQRLGATNDLLWNDTTATWVAGNTRPPPHIKGMRLMGAFEGNRKNPKAITAVASRTQFTVASGDAPAPGPNVGEYPFYGWCFFFSNEGRYLGSGIVQTIASGVCTLDTAVGSDLYGTVSPNILLTTNDVVCFSEVTTSVSGVIAPVTYANATKAGYAGIRMGQAGGEGAIVEDMYIRNFHTGLAIDPIVALKVKDCWFSGNAFASIAAQYLGKYYDPDISGCFLQGFYSQDHTWLGASPTNTIIDPDYQRTAIGLCSMGGTGEFDLICDAPVIGILSYQDTYASWKYCLIDQPVYDAIRSRGQNSADAPHQFSTTLIRSSVNSVVTNGAAATRPEAIRIYGNNGLWSFDSLAITELNAGSPFTYAFHLANSATRISVGALVSTNGAPSGEVSPTSVGTIYKPLRIDGAVSGSGIINSTNTFTARQTFTNSIVLASSTAVRWDSGAELILQIPGQLRFNVGSANEFYVTTSGIFPGTADTEDFGSAGASWNGIYGRDFIVRGGPYLTSSTGSPEGSVNRPLGSIYLQSNGSAGSTLWTKSTDGGTTNWVSTTSGHSATFSSDIGDSDTTIVGTSPYVTYYLTPLTSNRTVSITTNAMYLGQRFLIVREGLGSFTLNVGGLKTIPSATAGSVEFQFIGSALKLLRYTAN